MGGQDADPPSDVAGWLDWTGYPTRADRKDDDDAPWAHPNSRFTTTLANVPNIAADYDDARRRADRRDHLRRPHPRP